MKYRHTSRRSGIHYLTISEIMRTPLNSETEETVKPPLDPDQILALVDLIFLCSDEAKTIPS